MIEKPVFTKRNVLGPIIVFALFAGWRFTIEHSFQGPPQNRFLISNALGQLNTDTLAAAVRHEAFLGPSKLTRVLTFGHEPTLDLRPEAIILLGDIHTRIGVLLARIPSPDNTSSAFNPRILGWGERCVYVGFTGQRGSFWNGSQGPINRRFYRVALDGSVAELAHDPHPPKVDEYAAMPGETHFLRASGDGLTIQVQTVPRGKYHAVLRFDPSQSTLVSANDSIQTKSR